MGTISKVKQGDRYGRLVLTGQTKRSKSSHLQVECVCDCGKVGFKLFHSLLIGKTKSCGCLKVKHGLWSEKHLLYGVWMDMKYRCKGVGRNEKSYLLKGIKVCDEWINDYKAFYEWAIKNGWEKGLSLDRKKNDLGYYPDNCWFTTTAVQNRNKDNNVLLTAWGETKCLADWNKDHRCVVAFNSVKYRMNKKGWSAEMAMSEPDMSKDRTKRKGTLFIHYNGEQKRLFDVCFELGIKYRTVRERIYRHGWSVEKALHTPINISKINKKNRA